MAGSARKLVSLALGAAVACGLACWGPIGCSDTSRRMSEGEALQYKRALVKENQTQISETEAVELMYHPARTKAELDRYLAELRKRFAARQAADQQAGGAPGKSSATAKPSGTSSGKPAAGTGGSSSPAGSSGTE